MERSVIRVGLAERERPYPGYAALHPGYEAAAIVWPAIKTCSYPFTAPAIRPETMRRWKISTAVTSGRVTITLAAMIFPQGSS